MTTLVALLSTGKGSWGQVAGLVKKGEWEKIILLGPAFAKEFTMPGETFDFIEFDPNKSLVQLKKELLSKLKPKLDTLDFGAETALSIASGNGKEHMALISALLSVPVGVRFTALTKDGVVML
ncbi:hypothetical protein CMI41_03900 [Candidatus Pacearchaeota archaeon]|jgi:hypothetical protein|nr:hypothetical protein [Candidatus Pacearchaeota archaeon]|tara:strand:- start:5016 stop:5384 length:369 start_codon:yes stop_codon:yes gene_type:complete